MTQAAEEQSKPLAKGTVESISKRSIIVSHENDTTTLEGSQVESISGNLKLGDVVEFGRIDENLIVRLPAAKKTNSTAERRNGSSPAAAPMQDRVDW